MFGKQKDKEIKRLLAMRFSAMGDVAMTVPVLNCVARQNPQLRITVLTKSRMVGLYEWLPANVVVKGVDFEDYDGVMGLSKLYRELKKGNFDAVCDLHDVLRTKYLRTCFKMSGTPVSCIDKGRKDKDALIGNASGVEALPPMVERYADVFRALGLKVDLSEAKKISTREEDMSPVRLFAGSKKEGETWIGVAPFAAHEQKVYPLDRMKRVVDMLCEKGCKVFLFGAGKEESETLSEWEREGVKSVCGKLGGLHNEMLLMSKLDVMLSMDSANMHLASLMGTRVVSIWGATHPKAGFVGFGQKEEDIVQIELPCRPCSIYGNKACQHGDLRCMDIDAEVIVDKILSNV